MELLEYEKKHLEQIRGELAECTVLLKYDGSFPLSEAGQIALYGNGARRTIKGGSGSGEVNSHFFVNVESGLEASGFIITTKTWLDAYDLIFTDAQKKFAKTIKTRAKEKHTNIISEGMGAVMPEPEYTIPLEGSGDTAIYVLARTSGEGNDREFVPGDILLTNTEVRDISALQEKYSRFLLVLNVGGPVDLSPVAEKVGNILLLSQLGVETGYALSDILLGKENPSGKLTTTWASMEAYPRIGDFGEMNDTRYKEGIYVGYRYFDSARVEPLFPFGFGLSFSSFEISNVEATVQGEEILFRTVIKNTGRFPGKEVLQLYVSKPENRLDQPCQELAGFVKSSLLHASQEEELIIRCRMSDLSSYSSEAGCWILEKGDYFFRLGTDCTRTKVIVRIRLEEDIITRKAKNVCGTADFTDWKPETERIETFLPEIPIIIMEPKMMCRRETENILEEGIDYRVSALSDEDLISMSIGAYDPKGHLGSIIGSASVSVAGAAGETSKVSERLGLKPLVMADGPAGLRLSKDWYETENGPVGFVASIPESLNDLIPKAGLWLINKLKKKPPVGVEIRHHYATALPIGTAIAQSWNLSFAEQCGNLVGDEMERMGIQLWLAPALNIHRDIRCGRNFEYYSEDPMLSGLFAAAITRGVQSHPSCGVTIKHFAANNQETNRYNSNSIVSERALREIYLRGFGICIREAQPKAIMTSYNLINGIHTSEHPGLLQDILRGEFGFDGIIMTDWVIRAMKNKDSIYPDADAAHVAAVGGELFMPGCKDDAVSMRKAIRSGLLSRQQLEKNVSGLVRKIRAFQT